MKRPTHNMGLFFSNACHAYPYFYTYVSLLKTYTK